MSICSTNRPQFVQLQSQTQAEQQSVTKIVYRQLSIWSHLVVLLKSDLDVEQTCLRGGLVQHPNRV
jgi:hypothetical protein